MLLLVFDAAGNEDEVLPGVRGNHLEHYVYRLREVRTKYSARIVECVAIYLIRFFLLKTLIINKKKIP